MNYQPDIETWIADATTRAVRDNVIVVAQHGLEPHIRVFPDGSVGIRRERWEGGHIHTDYELRGGVDSFAGAWAGFDIVAGNRAAGLELGTTGAAFPGTR